MNVITNPRMTITDQRIKNRNVKIIPKKGAQFFVIIQGRITHLLATPPPHFTIPFMVRPLMVCPPPPLVLVVHFISLYYIFSFLEFQEVLVLLNK